jgi:hypothetical protein
MTLNHKKNSAECHMLATTCYSDCHYAYNRYAYLRIYMLIVIILIFFMPIVIILNAATLC